MALLLGVDTGGTYTDAAVLDDAAAPDRAVIAKAKALTTRPDLAAGIGEAIRAALARSGAAPQDIALVSLSTTLATNALGQGEPVALVAIGFPEAALRRAGLAEALDEDPAIRIAGGHDAAGGEAAPLDLGALTDAFAAAADSAATHGRALRGVAVTAQFSVRNPAHEIAARDAIRGRFGLPVTCSHELSARVGGPRRALTTLLNARLIGLIDRLIAAVEGLMREIGIRAPLMVVRGDGALAAADFAKARPIETILSGPAASLVGAGFLTGVRDALVSDIGGTTTDIAVLRDGRPRLDPDGARVGGHATMVEAVAMATHGLGGDSEVRLAPDGLGAALLLGPRRAMPLSLLARAWPETLDRLIAQRDAQRPRDTDGRFLVAAGPAPEGLAPREAALMARIADGPQPMETLAVSRPDAAAAGRLIARGLARLSAFTPSDAAHALGLQSDWNAEAARLGALLLARQRTGAGKAWAASPEEACERALARLRRLSAEAVLETCFAEDGLPAGLSLTPLAAAALDGRSGLARTAIRVTRPLVGLGASAPVHYPQVAALLGTEPLIPAHADVANAVGAVAGRVGVTRRATITSPADGLFRVHLDPAPEDFADFEAARAAAERRLRAAAEAAAALAGAEAIEVRVTCDIRRARIEGRDMIVEALVEAEASGRPRLAAAP